MAGPFRCWAEVDLAALRHNLGLIRRSLRPGLRIITVVKADAYGHGLKHVAAALMHAGTDMFGVANLAEARAIRSVGRGWPILMLGPCLPHEFESAVRDQVTGTISSLREAESFSCAAQQLGTTAGVQVKIDTGMGRIGTPCDQVLPLVREIQRLPGLRLDGVYTHFASVEDQAEFTRVQRERFAQCLSELRNAGVRLDWIHASNSGGVLLEDQEEMTAVRPGLLVYGVVPPSSRASASCPAPFQPALRWSCRVGLVKEVPAGTPLSYGGIFTTLAPARIATLSAGYGDGYLRAGSNRAHVLIRGQRCPIVGRITMDQMLADVSAVNGVDPGDEAVLIGSQNSGQITATELAEWFGTIPWEVLSCITYRVPRVYRGTQAA